ncbi:bactofilin family protein [Yokenella regensburgei]|uniref:bactofilin family protein n=1 Tax=Yokenella regensburgei TaxID=158877 RepID=UPI003EDAA1FC
MQPLKIKYPPANISNSRNSLSISSPDLERDVDMPKQYECLWLIWLTWGALLVLWGGYGNEINLRQLFIWGVSMLLWVIGCSAVIIKMKRVKREMGLLKKKEPTTDHVENMKQKPSLPSEAADLSTNSPATGMLRDVVLTAVRRDVFIAHGSHISGLLEAEGNTVIEGSVEGNVTSVHQIRVETGGTVKGDLHAAHIVINGLVTGRCYAAVVTLLDQGHIEGDIFTDELEIERGGIFIGQSSLPPEEYTAMNQEKVNEREALHRDDHVQEDPLKQNIKTSALNTSGGDSTCHLSKMSES